MTNGDRIRSMTDRELADFLISEDATACNHCEYFDKGFERCTLDLCVNELASTILENWLSTESEKK